MNQNVMKTIKQNVTELVKMIGNKTNKHTVRRESNDVSKQVKYDK